MTKFRLDVRALSTLGALCAVLGACSKSTPSAASDTTAAASSPTDTSTDPPARAARLSALDGDVSLEAPGSDSWATPTTNYTVTTGDRLHTGSGARAELDLGDGAMRLDPDADVTVTNLDDHYEQFGVDQGPFDASLYQYDPADSIEIDTPNGVLVPGAAGAYELSVDPTSSSTLVNVISGILNLIGPGLTRQLGPGVVRLLGTNPIQVAPWSSPVPAFTQLDRWRAERDPHWQPTGTAPRYVSERVPGWEDLDPNGRWTTDQTNTQVWCPSNASSSYVPYQNGQWAWVEPWGWTWVDDAPWGYATTHYGRWEQLHGNSTCADWAWVPAKDVAEPVYTPAAVEFVDGANLDVNGAPQAQAWFPLGPQEPYFPSYHHSDAYLQRINATNLREVSNVRPLIQPDPVANMHWVNRDAALTAVPAPVFAAGDPVRPHMIHVRPPRIAAAPVLAHPTVNPEPQLMRGGHPAPRPPKLARPPMVQTRAAARPAPGRVAPVQHGRPGIAATPMTPTQPNTPRPIMTRHAPPPARPSPAAVAPAMRQHPGRPLEPQQVQKVRAGQPAGPPRDREVPSHAGTRPAPGRPSPAAAAPAAAPRRAAPGKAEPPNAAPGKSAGKGRGGPPAGRGNGPGNRGGKPGKP